MILLPVRALVRNAMSDASAVAVAERFVSAVPHVVQRSTERYFDFPIPRCVRSNGVLLIRIPRTASVSLSMRIYGRVEGIAHRTASFYRTSDPAFVAAATKLAVVRNPWTRLISAYDYLRSSGSDVAGPNAAIRARMASIRSFEQFVYDYVEPGAEALHRLDPTVHGQNGYVCDEAGRLIVENIFRFETLDVLNDFLSRRGIGSSTRHLNGVVRMPSVDVRTLSASLVDTVGRIYAKDAGLFGYAPPGG